MKIHPAWAVISLAALFAAPAVAVDQCGHCNHSCACGSTHGHEYRDSYWESSMWPQQYIQPSRRGICQAYETMINNGWRRHNLLGKYHFNAEGTELSEAGKLKVQWALTQAPAHRRVLFVERGEDQEKTAARMAAVQTLASTVNTGGAQPDIQETYLREEGHPAGAVDKIFTGFRAGQLPPMLPQVSNNSSSQ